MTRGEGRWKIKYKQDGGSSERIREKDEKRRMEESERIRENDEKRRMEDKEWRKVRGQKKMIRGEGWRIKNEKNGGK